jgi:hypothetical protein
MSASKEHPMDTQTTSSVIPHRRCAPLDDVRNEYPLHGSGGFRSV